MQQKQLIVQQPFANYSKGDVITDQKVVADLLADANRRGSVTPFIATLPDPEPEPETVQAEDVEERDTLAINTAK